jgi:endo-1,4-beta-xylanase
MRVVYSLNPILQAENETAIVDMFKLLAQSGKLIRISELTMGLVDANGVAVSTKGVTSDQQFSLSQYFNFIISKYFEIIPDEQRYGISINNPVDTDNEYGLWNTQYNRNITYTGFADGLKGE